MRMHHFWTPLNGVIPGFGQNEEVSGLFFGPECTQLFRVPLTLSPSQGSSCEGLLSGKRSLVKILPEGARLTRERPLVCLGTFSLDWGFLTTPTSHNIDPLTKPDHL